MIWALIDRGEQPGLSTEGQMELAAAKRRIRQLETELAVSRKVNEVFLEQDLPPRASTRYRVFGRAGDQCATSVRDARCRAIGLLRLGGPPVVGQDAPARLARRRDRTDP